MRFAGMRQCRSRLLDIKRGWRQCITKFQTLTDALSRLLMFVRLRAQTLSRFAATLLLSRSRLWRRRFTTAYLS